MAARIQTVEQQQQWAAVLKKINHAVEEEQPLELSISETHILMDGILDLGAVAAKLVLMVMTS